MLYNRKMQPFKKIIKNEFNFFKSSFVSHYLTVDYFFFLIYGSTYSRFSSICVHIFFTDEINACPEIQGCISMHSLPHRQATFIKKISRQVSDRICRALSRSLIRSQRPPDPSPWWLSWPCPIRHSIWRNRLLCVHSVQKPPHLQISWHRGYWSYR